jgi:hypothetical protein
MSEAAASVVTTRVHDAALVAADVRLHAKVPLLALARLVHLRIARLVLILGRGRSCDDRGVHNGAGLEQQVALLQAA